MLHFDLQPISAKKEEGVLGGVWGGGGGTFSAIYFFCLKSSIVGLLLKIGINMIMDDNFFCAKNGWRGLSAPL